MTTGPYSVLELIEQGANIARQLERDRPNSVFVSWVTSATKELRTLTAFVVAQDARIKELEAAIRAHGRDEYTRGWEDAMHEESPDA